jgi:hypothetical protein
MKSLLITTTVVLGMALYKFLLGELVHTRPVLTAVIILFTILLWGIGFWYLLT